MNKGIELIEAMYLFGLDESQVDAFISPGSFVHGLVEFEDGSVKLLAAEPDMKLPAASCIFWPERNFPCQEFHRPQYPLHDVRFEEIDAERSPAVRIARECMKLKGGYPAVLVGADESAVSMFLEGRIGFTDIAGVVESVLGLRKWDEPSSLDEAVRLVEIGRQEALRLGRR